MGGGKGGSKQKIYDYLMSIDYGVCHGPVDQFNFVTAKEKMVYLGPVTGSGTAFIDKKKLFGGDSGEGGVKGTAEFYLGGWDQRMSTALANRFGLTPDVAPGYRGLAHIFFRGGDSGTQLEEPLFFDNFFGFTPPAQREEEVNTPGFVLVDDLFVPPAPPEPDDPPFTVGEDVVKNLWFGGIADPEDDVDEGENPVPEDTIPGAAYGLDYYFGDLWENPGPDNDSGGFMWTTNNPYLPPVEVGVTRMPDTPLSVDPVIPAVVGVDAEGDFIFADPADAFVEPENPTTIEEGYRVNGGYLNRNMLPNANPAHMIYEAMTNDLWGKGDVDAVMNIDSFDAAAQTLLDEGFGLSMRWMAQDDHEKIVSEILDHIDAFFYQSPTTGLWTLKLVRGDYDERFLPVFDPGNCEAFNIKRTLWDETINEVVVSYTDPVSEEQETVSAQNGASIAIIGGVRSDPRDYHAVRDPYLAKKIAERDVAKASRSLLTASLHANRQFAAVAPGDVLKLNWPDENVDNVVMRVTSVEPGHSGDRKVKIDVTEDVFAARRLSTPVSTQDPLGLPPPETPRDPSRVMLMAPPWPFLIQNGEEPEEPQGYVSFFVNDALTDPISIHAVTDVITSSGLETKEVVQQFTPVPVRALGDYLVPGVYSVLPIRVVESLLDEPEIGDMLVIGNSEDNHEIVMLVQRESAAGRWVIARGMHDTVPENWGPTDLIWEMTNGAETTDPEERVVGEVVDYNLLPETRLGTLQIDDSTTYEYTVSDRLYRPFRPANVQIDGNGFAPLSYVGAAVPATIEITWVNRNRETEDSVAPVWTDATLAPEVGQTTTIRFRDSYSGQLDHEITGLTGTSVTVPVDDIPSFRYYDVEVLAVRDGYESFRSVVRQIELERFGYGNNYGFDYGQNDGDV